MEIIVVLKYQAKIAVHYLPCEQWQPTRFHIKKPLDFGLFDETRLWIHDDLINANELRTATLYALRKSDEMIGRHKRLFEANWAQSLLLGEVEIRRAQALGRI